MSRIPLAVLAAAGALTMAACGSSSSSSTAGSGAAPSSAPASGSTTGTGTGLATASTDLGTVVVDGGRTVYTYDADTPGSGTSACAGGCLSQWPPVEGSTHENGVTGKVGTIRASDGGTQLTLDGRPLYYYAGDAAPGDTSGQGVGGTWWAVTPAGAKVTSGGGAASSAPANKGYGGGGY